MGLMAPWFLVGVAAIALPVYLHLLRRQEAQPLKFSSLMFFEKHPISSVKRRRLRYLALLAMRVLLLLLLALAFSNPFVRRAPAAGAAAGKLTVAAIDRSFSMRAEDRMERARREALGVLSRLGPAAPAQVLAFGSGVQLMTQATADRGDLRAAVEAVEPDDSRSSYAELTRALGAIARSSAVPVEVHLISDMQKTSMPPSFTDLELAPNLAMIPHPLAKAARPNWAVESVAAPRRVTDPAKSRVQVTVAGFATPAARRTVTLLVNGKTQDTRTVDVPASGRAAVEFPRLDVPHGFSSCEVRVDAADALAEDNAFLFAVEHGDPRRLLFVYEERQARSLLYVRAALESSPAASFVVEPASPERAAGLTPSKYEVVLLSDTAELPEPFEAALKSWVRGGGSLFIAAGPATAARRRLPIVDSAVTELRYAAREGARFRSVAETDTAHPALRSAGRLEGARFYQTTGIGESEGRVLARLDDRAPLLIERKLGAGKVLVFASTLDNVSNDLPLRAAFVPFLEQAADYLSGEESHSVSVPVGAFHELRAAGDQGLAAEVLDPAGKRVLSFAQAAEARGVTLSTPGFYDIRRAAGRRELVAVNADRRESDLDVVSAETLALWQNTGQGGSAAAAAREPKPWALGWHVLLGVLLLAIVESVFGMRYLAGEETR